MTTPKMIAPKMITPKAGQAPFPQSGLPLCAKAML